MITTVEKFMIILFLAFNFFLGGLCVQYSVEYWGPMIKGQPVDIPFWVAGLIGIPLAEPAIVVALVTVALSYVI